MHYKKVSTDLSFVDRELEIEQLWKDRDIFNKSMQQREGGEVFTFYDGPPTANGKPHIGHVLTRAVKDIIPRYKTMKGYSVLRKAGWDTHGLPVELEIEKQLGISGKPQIENYGVEPFIKQCKESVWKYKGEWEKMSDRVGFWADMEHPYVTYDNNYIESVWWALRRIWDKGLLYKGHKIMPYCARCGTSLSSHEVAQGYKDVKEPSIIVKFQLKSGENEFILAWTTTPWTLPSNVALCVNANEDYVKVEVESGEKYILAKALVETVIKEECKIIEEYKGADLKGLEYVPLFDFVAGMTDKKGWYVVCDDYVTLTDGTGVVHQAPAFGEDDARVCLANDMPFVNLVNTQGKFEPEAGEFAGMFVKDADKPIMRNLKERGQLFSVIDYEHSYPFCWRCDTPLLYYACDTWFIKMSSVREKLLEYNRRINWMPENIKEGRMGHFLENVIDWGLSRARYWGTPLPIWECACGQRHLVGSIAELKEKGINVPDDIELHKPYIDNVKLTCDECGGEMTRVGDVIDCWFDAGSMPFAQWHYPFENKEIFEANYPADFISEAIDQTRGWFYTMLAISTLLFDEPAYKNVIVLGHVQDKHGHKMSKHTGNVVDPWDVLNKQGADAVRWYFFSNSAPWIPNKFHDAAVSESQRKFLGTLWNTYAFYVLYANIDDFHPSKYTFDPDKLSLMDKWIFSKLNTVIAKVDGLLEQYKITEATREMNEFVDELSNWYVRRCRERFWASEMTDDKIAAYMTLYTVLIEFAKLCAPFVPFMSEMIFQNLKPAHQVESVHLCDYPSSYEDFIFPNIEAEMDTARKVVILGRAARNEANIKNRQPIGKIYVQSLSPITPTYQEIILDELNVKELVLTDDASSFISYLFKPQLRTLGAKLGKLIKPTFELVNAMDGTEVMAKINAGEAITLTVEGIDVELEKDDILVETQKSEGFVSASDVGVTVVLDTNLTPELIEEGFVREIISKVQTMRKDSGFEVLDNIDISYVSGDKIAEIMKNHENEIKNQTLAHNITKMDAADDNYTEWNINGEKVSIALCKI